MKDECDELRKRLKAVEEIAELCLDALDDVTTEVFPWYIPASVQPAFDSGIAWRKSRNNS